MATTNDAQGGMVSRRVALAAGVGAGLGLALAGRPGGVVAQTPEASADGFTMERMSLTLDGALAIVDGAVAKARELGVPMVVVVVDESGVLKAFARMDGTGVASIDLATAKAYTAAAFRTPTHELAERVSQDPARLASFTSAPRVILLGGGLPIRIGESVVGGIGSGGGTPEQDIEVSQAGLAALGS